MDTKNIERKDGKVSFQVVVDPAAFEAAVNSAYLKNKKRINVPGFRRGKAPRKIIEGMYGKDVFHDEAVDSLALSAYQDGKKEAGDRTVGDPAITDYKVEDDGSLVISFESDLYPEVTLGEYKGLSAYRPSAEVTDEEVDREVEAVRKRNARIVTVERGAQMGDTVRIDFDGFRDGVRFSGGKGQNYSLTLGSGEFVPGFEEQVVGMKAGEEKDLDITFPEDYTPELAGAAVVFKVKVHEVQETVLPDLDDEFAMDVSEYDTLAEYRDSVRKEISERKEKSAGNTFRNGLQEKAAKNAEMKVPDSMINSRVQNSVEQLARDCRAQGMTLPQYLSMMGMDEAGYRRFLRPGMEKQIRVELTLEKIADTEGLEVTPEEVAAEFQSMSEQYEMPLERVKEIVPEEVVTTDLKVRKAADLLAENGVALDKPEEPEKPEAAENADAPAEGAAEE